MAVAILLLAATGLAVLDGNSQIQAGSVVAAIVAAASLIYSLGRTQEATKDQYTLTLIAKRFDDGDYATNVRIASDLRAQGVISEATGLSDILVDEYVDPKDDSKRIRIVHIIIPIINYWEHVCTAYVDDRINRDIFEDLIQDLIETLISRFSKIIGEARNHDPRNMEHLCAVWFVTTSSEQQRRFAWQLGPVPQRLAPHDKWRWEVAVAAPVFGSPSGRMGET
jgi:hypothetical protein